MTIIVRHRKSNKVYALIGTGYGAYKATTPSFLGGNLFPHEEEGEIPVAAVTNEEGEIQWFYTNELEVIEMDGVKIKEVLAPFRKTSDETIDEPAMNVCPACDTEILPNDRECPSCGLVFQIEEE
ncbi:hypothetical protein [Desulfitobacterium sp.]|uniref:hypothetical protein n=1 Tax=Desulfitobacterium sp. TaxID=49981 RepID=UPI002B204039|nr:hypothetical protein [Desulfitobacterium sp.]MEA4900534.1 hypothetical protein [Desulfitobacterium sp.]